MGGPLGGGRTATVEELNNAKMAFRGRAQCGTTRVVVKQLMALVRGWLILAHSVAWRWRVTLGGSIWGKEKR